MLRLHEIPLQTYFDHPDLSARVIDAILAEHQSRRFKYSYDTDADEIVKEEQQQPQHLTQSQRQGPPSKAEIDFNQTIREPDPEKRILSVIRLWLTKNGEAIHTSFCDRVGYCVFKEKYDSEIAVAKSLVDSFVNLHFWLPIPASTLASYLVQKKFVDRICQQYGPAPSRRSEA
jgi:hypothetical protein